MSSKTVYFVSGGNRGIGFGLVKKLSAIKNSLVIATSRTPEKSTELLNWKSEHPNVHILKYDATVHSDADHLAKEIGKLADGIDVFVANSATSEIPMTVLETPIESWTRLYNVNTLGPIVLFKALYPLIVKRQTRKVLFVSSGLSSQNSLSAAISSSSYGQSKSALNFTAKELSLELAKENFIVIPIYPGLVDTEMGSGFVDNLGKRSDESNRLADTMRSNMMITVEQSASAVSDIIESLSNEDNGKFLKYDRSIVPW
ncbi:hypothetical protein AWJ20_2615 [Sugiyamaella lignohabitans]|uniref:Uncharacterized protein n=1 Tax=Sugiyamaella lignohabitans TaxID=796027 RepID=A0A161HX38_9ASCO|nr:uncharacterized protein AWJ20_2615 [Sugiyamaella lignohabitans]ANB14996.1 hypothetical protein AWJ20_2615 [Sugiyamaella lignohabitans]